MGHIKSQSGRQVFSLDVVLPVSLLLFFLTTPLTTSALDSGLWHPTAVLAITTTRKDAVTNFIQALQMTDGSLVAKLTSPKSSAFISTTRDGIEPLDILDALEQINQTSTKNYILGCQGSTGKFFSTPEAALANGDTEVRYGAHGVTCLSSLNGLNEMDTSAFTSYLLSCQRSDGGFNDQPSVLDYAIWNTYYAVSALKVIGASFSKEDVIDNLMTYYNDDGGFSLSPSGSSDLSSTFYGIETLRLCYGLSRIDDLKTSNYVFTYYSDLTGSINNGLMHTFRGCKILNTLGNLAMINTTRVSEFVLSCQSSDHGGFKSRPSAVQEATSNCRRAILCLATLGKLSLLNQQIVISEFPVWIGDDGTTPPSTTPPPTPELFSPPLIIGLVAIGIISIVFVTFLLSPRTPKKRIKKVRKQKK